MKNLAYIFIFSLIVVGCSDRSTTVEQKMDSIGKKFDSSAERIWDSTKEKAKDIKGKIEDGLERKDTVNHSDTIKN